MLNILQNLVMNNKIGRLRSNSFDVKKPTDELDDPKLKILRASVNLSEDLYKTKYGFGELKYQYYPRSRCGVYLQDNAIYIGYRGTDPISISDFLNNLKSYPYEPYGPCQGKVHEGFWTRSGIDWGYIESNEYLEEVSFSDGKVENKEIAQYINEDLPLINNKTSNINGNNSNYNNINSNSIDHNNIYNNDNINHINVNHNNISHNNIYNNNNLNHNNTNNNHHNNINNESAVESFQKDTAQDHPAVNEDKGETVSKNTILDNILLNSRKLVVFCGHSSGGSTAICAAIRYIRYCELNNIEPYFYCITFGAPRCIDFDFLRNTTRYSSSFLNFNILFDPIPSIINDFQNYIHTVRSGDNSKPHSLFSFEAILGKFAVKIDDYFNGYEGLNPDDHVIYRTIGKEYSLTEKCYTLISNNDRYYDNPSITSLPHHFINKYYDIIHSIVEKEVKYQRNWSGPRFSDCI